MKVKAEAVALRYRAVKVAWTPDESTAYGEAREFKTLKGAMAHRDAHPGEWLIQTGILRWMSDDDAIAEIRRLQSEGHHIE